MRSKLWLTLMVGVILGIAGLVSSDTRTTYDVSVEARYLSWDGYYDDDSLFVEIGYHYGPVWYVSTTELVPFSDTYDISSGSGEVRFSISPLNDDVVFAFWRKTDLFDDTTIGTSYFADIDYYGENNFTVYYTGGTFDIWGVGIPDSVVAGETTDIVWVADSGVEQSALVRIDLSRNAGSSYTTIEDSVEYNEGSKGFDGEYTWDAVGPSSDQCRLRLILYDYAGNTDTAYSDIFEILPPLGDFDEDGVVDSIDICTHTYNPAQDTADMLSWHSSYGEALGFEGLASGIVKAQSGYFVVRPDTCASAFRWCHLTLLDECGSVAWDRPVSEWDYAGIGSDEQNRLSLSSLDDIPHIAVCNAGGHIVLQVIPFLDYRLIRLDELGDMLWGSAQLSGRFLATDIEVLADDGFLVCGPDGFVNGDIGLKKHTSAGSWEWSQNITPSIGSVAPFECVYVSEYPNGDLALAATVDADTLQWGYWLARCNGLGQIIWETAIIDDHRRQVADLIIDPVDTCPVILATDRLNGGEADVLVAKLSALDGQALWSTAIGGAGNDYVYCGAISAHGTIVGCGKTASWGVDDACGYVFSLASDGTVEWQLLVTHDDPLQYRSILPMPDSGFVVAGGEGSANDEMAIVQRRQAPDGEPCCQGSTGDINDDGGGDPDIADLVYLVTYMYQGGPPPPCMEAADINGDGTGPDIVDQVYLLVFMFQDGPPPKSCIPHIEES